MDFSEHSRRALEWAIALADKTGATLHLVHGLHLPPDLRAMPDWWTTLRAHAVSGLDAMVGDAEEAGAKAEAHMADDHPVEAILKLANELDADLIVMGTRGMTGLEHALLGSVAERIVRLAKCPVLTVRADTA